MLLCAVIHWPEETDLQLLPFALPLTVYENMLIKVLLFFMH